MRLYRDRTLLAISASVGMSMLGIGMVVPVRVLYAQAHGASLSVIGGMASSFLLSSFLFQYPVGWIADRRGKSLVMMVGLLGLAILTVFWLTITDPVLFIVLRFVEGFFAAGVVSSARAILAERIPGNQRGRAFGIFGASLSAGFLLGPALGGFLASTGYTLTFLGSAAFRVVAFGLVVLLVPRDHGTQHDGNARTGGGARRMLWSLPLAGAYILFFGDNFYFGFDLTLAPLWLKHHIGASITIIGLSYAVWSLPNVVLTPLGGRIADRVRRSTLILVFGILQIPCYVTFAFLSSVPAVLALFAVHGAIYAMMQPAVDANLAAFSPPEARARAQGVYGAIGMVGAFIASNVLSALYGINFRLPLLVMAAAFGLCVLVGGAFVRVGETRLLQADRGRERHTVEAVG